MNKQTLDEINAETITSQDFDNVCKIIDWLTQKSDTPNTGDHVAATMNGPYYREEKQIPFARLWRRRRSAIHPKRFAGGLVLYQHRARPLETFTVLCDATKLDS